MTPASRALAAALLAGLAVAPAAGAGHAVHAVYRLDDFYSGCRVTFDGAPAEPPDAWQSWTFLVAVERVDGACWTGLEADVCRVVGSVEAGFDGGCASTGYLALEGTGHGHACCASPPLDAHGNVSLTYFSGRTGWSYGGVGSVVALG